MGGRWGGTGTARTRVIRRAGGRLSMSLRPPVHSADTGRTSPRPRWLRSAFAALAAALFLCLSTMVDHQIPHPAHEATAGSTAVDVRMASVQTPLGGHPAGEAYRVPQTHYRALVTAQAQAQLSQQSPATLAPPAHAMTIMSTADTVDTIAPDLHVLQVLRT